VASKGHRGRPEGPLDPAAGAVANLAARLRLLREEAGRPSYRQLARTAFYSHSALSQAAAGRVLPSLAVTLAFVSACGGDRQEWMALWAEAAAEAGILPETGGDLSEAGTLTVPDGHAADVESAPETRLAIAARRGIRGRLARARRGRRLQASAGLAGLAGLACLAGILVWWGLFADATPPPAPPGGSSPPGDCTSLKVNLAKEIVDNHGQEFGYLWLRYSKKCGTAWARFSPVQSLSLAGAVTITVTVIRHPDEATRTSVEYEVNLLTSGEIPLPPGDCALASVAVAVRGQAPATTVTACEPPPSS
jgi:hypothetical protein